MGQARRNRLAGIVAADSPTEIAIQVMNGIGSECRYKINMIMGEKSVLMVDYKHQPALRSMKLDVDEVISESNFKGIFTDVVEALKESGQIADGETAACVTFPAGSTIHQTEIAKA